MKNRNYILFVVLLLSHNIAFAGGGTTGTGLKSAEQLGEGSAEENVNTKSIIVAGTVVNTKGAGLASSEVTLESVSDLASGDTDKFGKFELTMNPGINETITVTVKVGSEEASLDVSPDQLEYKKHLRLIFVKENVLKIEN